MQELKPKPGEQQVSLQVLNAFVRLASKQTSDAEAALAEFNAVLAEDNYTEHIAAILGTATAHMILKQVGRLPIHSITMRIM